MIAIGDPVPDFELAGIDGRTGEPESYRLADFRGRPVVLVFYPADNTATCTRQLLAYTADVADFERLDAQVLAISPQSPESHVEFASAQGGFAFPLLSDPDKEVGAAYGIVGLLGLYRRSSFVIDGEGILRYAHRSISQAGFRPSAELVHAVEGLPGRSN